MLSYHMWANLNRPVRDFFKEAVSLFWFVYFLEWFGFYLSQLVRSAINYAAASHIHRELIEALPVMNN